MDLKEFEADFIYRVKTRYHSKPYPPTTIKVTELIWCLRRAFYDRNEPPAFDIQQTLNFCRGRSLHDFILNYDRREIRLTKDFGDLTVVGYADVIEKDNIVEFKTSKAKRTLPETMKQALYYAAMADLKGAVIVTYHLFANEKPLSFGYSKLLSAPRTLNEIHRLALLLKTALITNDPKKLPATQSAWLCKCCRHREKCKKG